jgi:hypothetical protein
MVASRLPAATAAWELTAAAVLDVGRLEASPRPNTLANFLCRRVCLSTSTQPPASASGLLFTKSGGPMGGVTCMKLYGTVCSAPTTIQKFYRSEREKTTTLGGGGTYDELLGVEVLEDGLLLGASHFDQVVLEIGGDVPLLADLCSRTRHPPHVSTRIGQRARGSGITWVSTLP